MTTDATQPVVTYISLTDTAKAIRKVLKERFPTIAFSVRCERYAFGASIGVWFDRNISEDLNSAVGLICKHYEGAEFDGSIDLQSYKNTMHDINGVPTLVNWGADYVFPSHVAKI